MNNKMFYTFTEDPIHTNDIVVFLRNHRTGSRTPRKCKFIGLVTGFTNEMVKIKRLSWPDEFVEPNECVDFGEVRAYPEDVVHIISHIKENNNES